MRKKIFKCVKCQQPCFETVFLEEVEDHVKQHGEIWLLCEDCLETLSPSVDLLVPREMLDLH